VLILDNCAGLSSLPREIGQLRNLRVLKLDHCESLTSLPPEIRNLPSLEYVELSPGINIVEFIEQGGMEGWTSLRMLCLSMNECRPRLSKNEYLRIFHHLPSWLVDLQLYDDIDSINFFSRIELPSRFRVLEISSCSGIVNSSNQSDKQSVVDLLTRYFYLGFICSNFHNTGLYSPLAEHYLDINESGRGLIEGGGHPIPLLVWPIVLERVNQKLTQRDEPEYDEDDVVFIDKLVDIVERELHRRANAIYYILHGPALAAHENLV
jgi:hypothetical protein